MADFIQILGMVFVPGSELAKIIGVTLQMACFSTVISTVIGVPLGILIGLSDFRGKRILMRVLNTLMGLPPVIAGLIVFFILSRSGPLGTFRLLYTVTAMVIAQVLIITPIVCGISATALSELAPRVHETVRGFGLSRAREILYLLYQSRSQLISMVFVAFGRSIGEVGAVMLVGGNVQYKTRVMTTAIMLETNKGNFEFAIALGVLLLLISFIINSLALSLEERTHGMEPRSWFRRKARSLSSALGDSIPALRLPQPVPGTLAFGAQDLVKDYGTRRVLDAGELDLRFGNSYALIGPNGAGKTTLIRIFAGTLEPTGGTIQSNVGHIGYLPQKPYLFDFTVRKNVEIALAESDLPKEEVAVRVDWALRQVGMEHLVNQRGSHLSGGESQRVALARLLAMDCDALLLDEPTSSMDIRGTLLVEKALAEYRRRTGCVVLVSTHAPSQAGRLAEEILFLDEGTVLEQGPSAQLLAEPMEQQTQEFLAYWRL